MEFLYPMFAVGVVVVLWSWFQDPWRRRFDLKVLWPQFKSQAGDLERAREGFIVHMGMDPAWQNHCRDWTEEQFGDFVRENLK